MSTRSRAGRYAIALGLGLAVGLVSSGPAKAQTSFDGRCAVAPGELGVAGDRGRDARLNAVNGLIGATGGGRQLSNWGFAAPPATVEVGQDVKLKPRATYVTIDKVLGFNGNCRVTTAQTRDSERGVLETAHDITIERRGPDGSFEVVSQRDGETMPEVSRFAEQGVYRVTAVLRRAVPSAFQGVPTRLSITVRVVDPALARGSGLVRLKVQLPQGFAGSGMVIRGDQGGVGATGRGVASQCNQRFAFDGLRVDATILHETSHSQQLTDQRERPFGNGIWTLVRTSDGSLIKRQNGGERFLLIARDLGNGSYALRLEAPEVLQPKGLQSFRIPPAVRQITVLDCGPPVVAETAKDKGVNCKLGQGGARNFASREAFDGFVAQQTRQGEQRIEDRQRVQDLEAKDPADLSQEEQAFLAQATADVRCEDDELEVAIDPIPLGNDQGEQAVNPLVEDGDGATVTTEDFITEAGAEPQHQPPPIGLTCPLLEKEIARRQQQVQRSCAPALALMTKLVLAAPRFATKLQELSKLQRSMAERHAFVSLGAATPLILPRAIAADLQELAKIERAFRTLVSEAHAQGALVSTADRFKVLLEVSRETAAAILPGQTPKDAVGAQLINVVTDDRGEQVVQFLQQRFPRRNPNLPGTIGDGLAPGQFEFPDQRIADRAERAQAFEQRMALFDALRLRFRTLQGDHETVRRRLIQAVDAYEAERQGFNASVEAAFAELTAMKAEHERNRSELQRLFESNALEHCLGRFASPADINPLQSVSLRDLQNRPNPAAGLPGMNVVMPDIAALKNVVPVLGPIPKPKKLAAQFINVPPFDRFFPFEVKRNGQQQREFDVESKELARQIKQAEIEGKSAAVREILFKALFQLGRSVVSFGGTNLEVQLEGQTGRAIESPDEAFFKALTGVDVNLENDIDFVNFRDQTLTALRNKPFHELVQEIGNAINPILALKEGQELAERAGEAAFARGDIGIATAFAGLLLGDASLFAGSFDPASLDGQSLNQRSALLDSELAALEKDDAAIFASPLALLSIIGALGDVTGAGALGVGLSKSLDDIVGGLVNAARRDQAAKLLGESLEQAGDAATAQFRLNALREQLDQLTAQGLLDPEEATGIASQIDELLEEVPDTSGLRDELAKLTNRDVGPADDGSGLGGLPSERPKDLGQQSDLVLELRRLSDEASDVEFKATDAESDAAADAVRDQFVQLAKRVLDGEVGLTDEAGEFIRVVEADEINPGDLAGVGNTARVVRDTVNPNEVTKFLDAKLVDGNNAAAQFKQIFDEQDGIGFFPDDEVGIVEVRSGDPNIIKFEDIPTKADLEAFMRERALLELADQLQGTALLDEAGIDHARILGVGTAKQKFFVREGVGVVEVEIDVPFLRTEAVDASKTADKLAEAGQFSDDHVFEVIRLIEESSDKRVIHGDPNQGNIVFRENPETGELQAIPLEAGVLGQAETADLARMINLSGFGVADAAETNPLRAAGLARTPAQNGVLGKVQGNFAAKDVFPPDVLEILPDRALTKEFLRRYDLAKAEGPEALQAFHANRQQVIADLRAEAGQTIAKVQDLEDAIQRSNALVQKLSADGSARQQIDEVGQQLDRASGQVQAPGDEVVVPVGELPPIGSGGDSPPLGLDFPFGDEFTPAFRPDDDLSLPGGGDFQQNGWLWPSIDLKNSAAAGAIAMAGLEDLGRAMTEVFGLRAAHAQANAVRAFILARVGNPPRFIAQKVLAYRQITKKLVRELEEKRRNGLCEPEDDGGAGGDKRLPPGVAQLIPPIAKAIEIEISRPRTPAVTGFLVVPQAKTIEIEISRPGGVITQPPIGDGEHEVIRTELENVDIILGFNPFDRSSIESLETLQGRGFEVSEEILEDPVVVELLDDVQELVDSGQGDIAQEMLENMGVQEEVAEEVVDMMGGGAPPVITFFSDTFNCSAFGGGNAPFTIERDSSGNVTLIYQAPALPFGLQTILGPFAQDTVINQAFNVQDPVATAAIPFPQSLTEVVQQAVTLSFSVASAAANATILAATCGAGVQGPP